MILKMVNLSLLDTDQYFEPFDFRETPAFKTEQYENGDEYSVFDDAGYSSSNFFLLLGPMLLIIPVFLAYAIIMELIQW